MPELKPCPFCGGRAALYVSNGVRVICLNCNASTMILTDMLTTSGISGNATQAVINAWNRRTSDV